MYQAKLIKKERLKDQTWILDFSCPWLTWTPGQHVDLNLQVENKNMSKAFTIISSPTSGVIRLITRHKQSSSYKEKLLSLAPSEWLTMSLPYGHTYGDLEGDKLVFISSGVGAAGLWPLMETLETYDWIHVDRSSHLFDFLRGDRRKRASLVNRHSLYRHLDQVIQVYLLKSEDPKFLVCGSQTFVGDIYGHLMDMGFSDEDMITEGKGFQSLCGCHPDRGCGCGRNLMPMSGA